MALDAADRRKMILVAESSNLDRGFLLSSFFLVHAISHALVDVWYYYKYNTVQAAHYLRHGTFRTLAQNKKTK